MRFIVFRRLRRPLRLILKITVILIALFAVLYAGWFWFSRRVIPKTRGRVRVSGVSAPVEILRDTDGIPHIYARNMEDLYFGQGYVHAQDRYWQMEFWRRMATGRLSEVLGSAAKEPDILLRTLGYQRVAEREYAEYDTVSRRLLQAYADGVNAYTSRRKPAKLGLEFSLLKITGAKFEIEPWTPVNTLAWVKFIAHAMSTQVTHEIFRVELVAAVGHSLMKDFFSPYRFEEMPVIVRDFNPAALSNGQISIRKDLRKEPIVQLKTEFTASAVFAAVRDMAFGFGYGTGSNNWVISSARSRTGKPLLANDPHLDIQIPSLWYEIGLHCEADDLNIRGFSFPGLPAVLVGHNDYIAWGATNSVPDVEDLYIERINPRNPRQYEYNGKWMDMEVRYEEIRIKGEKYPHVFPVRITQHGPIISDQETVVRFDGFSIKPLQPFPENLDLTALSLRCTALEQNKTFKALTSLNSARNFNQFRGALRYWSVPSQNFVYADVNGNIGYQLPGLIPIRKHTDGSVPSPGWVDDYEWQGYIPFDELPMAYNPSSGYIVTANNPPVGAEYPYSIGTGFVYGYRARRIVDMIEADRDGISIEDIKAMQGDTLNLSASEILPYVEALKSQDREVTAVREHLLQWDRRMESDSSGAALYSYFFVSLIQEVFRDQIPDALWTQDKALGSLSRLQNTLHYLLQKPDSLWWDNVTTPEVIETRTEILNLALKKAYESGSMVFGRSLRDWEWGDVHGTVFEHQVMGRSGINLLKMIFNRGPVATGGGMSQVISNDFMLAHPFKTWIIPSMRQIIDLGDLSNSLMIHATGQSGHPSHRHYDDFIDPWSNVQFHTTRWEKKDAEADAEALLILLPKETAGVRSANSLKIKKKSRIRRMRSLCRR